MLSVGKNATIFYFAANLCHNSLEGFLFLNIDKFSSQKEVSLLTYQQKIIMGKSNPSI